MNWPLQRLLPAGSSPEPTEDELLNRFLTYVSERGLELYPAQEEAILELFSGKNVILNTPTGSGKSLVATALHFQALAHGRRSVYTCPIKALVNEKFLSLCRDFGPDNVGMATGDGSVNSDAPILCCTAEILANDALRLGESLDVADVIMDEFHYYSDRERGVAWQVPLLTLGRTRFLLMSATLGDTEVFEKGLTRLNALETVVVRSTERPVPLDFEYRETPLHETVADLIARGRAPIYVVNFTQAACAEEAQNFLSTDFCTKDEKKAIAVALEGVKFTSPYGKDVQKLLKHGVGLHHAGLLPRYRILVEKLAQKGLLKLICGTDTLGVGVNVPIRTVLFTKLCKYDGEKTAILSARDFHQIAGRAGRKGFDDRGTVAAQAPEHVIENLRMEQKAAGDPKKLRKIVKRKPPERGYVPWNKETFLKLVGSPPEALVSRFKVTHGMLLNVLSREGDGCRAMRRLIHDSHESPNAKRQHGKHAFQLFRSLVERRIIELAPLRLHVELQEDFSLHQTLSLYLIDTLHLLDPGHPEYSLDVLTLVESILEDPELILQRQLNALKGAKVAELKEQGMEYDERMEELEKLEYPKPRRDFIYGTFNEFAARHPWIGQENIRPKSIAREMIEKFMTFPEYIREYDLQRAEGLLLRYLSEVYKALVQTVPGYAKNDEIFGIAVTLGSMVRQIDASLLDEWERLRNPARLAEAAREAAGGEPEAARGAGPIDITWDRKAFTVMVRNEAFRFVRELARGNWAGALECVRKPKSGGEGEWSEEELSALAAEHAAEHGRILTDARARHPQNTVMAPIEGREVWGVQQILCDPDGHDDWVALYEVDLEASRAAERPVLDLVALRAL